jgi:hypothetical protein
VPQELEEAFHDSTTLRDQPLVERIPGRHARYDNPGGPRALVLVLLASELTARV